MIVEKNLTNSYFDKAEELWKGREKNGGKTWLLSEMTCLAERVLGAEVTFSFRCKTSYARCKRIQRFLAPRFSAWRIQNNEKARISTSSVTK